MASFRPDIKGYYYYCIAQWFLLAYRKRNLSVNDVLTLFTAALIFIVCTHLDLGCFWWQRFAIMVQWEVLKLHLGSHQLPKKNINCNVKIKRQDLKLLNQQMKGEEWPKIFLSFILLSCDSFAADSGLKPHWLKSQNQTSLWKDPNSYCRDPPRTGTCLSRERTLPIPFTAQCSSKSLEGKAEGCWLTVMALCFRAEGENQVISSVCSLSSHGRAFFFCFQSL